MIILSWNIQAAQGVDGLVSIKRIASDIKALADADVICLQEVLHTHGENQLLQYQQLFPEHTLIFGPAVDRLDGKYRLQFGNIILCRLPLLQVVHHKLPQPAEPEAKHMPRAAIQVIVDHANEPLRIVTTHLDYFAQQQRSAQTSYLASHQQQCVSRFKHPSPAGGEAQFAALPETDLSVYCGDYNFNVDSTDYQCLTSQTSDADDEALHDCWRLVHDSTPHEPTCGIFDHIQWQEGPHCRDFFFVSSALASRVKRMAVDTNTAASDHQPLYIEID